MVFNRPWLAKRLFYKEVRPKGFEPLTPWFEDAYSKPRRYLENKEFWQFVCATEPAVTPTYALELVDTVLFL
jgi:hypothetical protein